MLKRVKYIGHPFKNFNYLFIFIRIPSDFFLVAPIVCPLLNHVWDGHVSFIAQLQELPIHNYLDSQCVEPLLNHRYNI